MISKDCALERHSVGMTAVSEELAVEGNVLVMWLLNRSPPLLVKWRMTNRPVQGQICVDIFDGVHVSGMVV